MWYYNKEEEGMFDVVTWSPSDFSGKTKEELRSRRRAEYIPGSFELVLVPPHPANASPSFFFFSRFHKKELWWVGRESDSRGERRKVCLFFLPFVFPDNADLCFSLHVCFFFFILVLMTRTWSCELYEFGINKAFRSLSSSHASLDRSIFLSCGFTVECKYLNRADHVVLWKWTEMWHSESDSFSKSKHLAVLRPLNVFSCAKHSQFTWPAAKQSGTFPVVHTLAHL